MRKTLISWISGKWNVVPTVLSCCRYFIARNMYKIKKCLISFPSYFHKPFTVLSFFLIKVTNVTASYRYIPSNYWNSLRIQPIGVTTRHKEVLLFRSKCWNFKIKWNNRSLMKSLEQLLFHWSYWIMWGQGFMYQITNHEISAYFKFEKIHKFNLFHIFHSD